LLGVTNYAAKQLMQERVEPTKVGKKVFARLH